MAHGSTSSWVLRVLLALVLLEQIRAAQRATDIPLVEEVTIYATDKMTSPKGTYLTTDNSSFQVSSENVPMTRQTVKTTLETQTLLQKDSETDTSITNAFQESTTSNDKTTGTSATVSNFVETSANLDRNANDYGSSLSVARTESSANMSIIYKKSTTSQEIQDTTSFTTQNILETESLIQENRTNGNTKGQSSSKVDNDVLDSTISTLWQEVDNSTAPNIVNADINDVNSTTEATTGREWIQIESQKYTLYWAGWYIHLIWLPIIVPIGTIGNLFSFLIMMQRHNRRISCCLYMAALAVCDSVALFRKGYEWLIYMFGKPYVQIECQILAYFGLGSIQLGMFLIVGMTVDRVIAIKFPLKAHIYCTPFRAKLTIFIFLIVACLFNIPHFVTARQIGHPPYTCATFSAHLPYIEVYAWGSTVLNFFLPFIGLSVMNIVIVSTIRRRAKKLNKSNEEEGSGAVNGGGGNSTADRQLAIMLCLVGVFFVILNMPQCIRLTMFLFVDRWASPYNHAVYIFVFHFSNKTYYTNNGINFFLYCIGGSKFRESLKKLCCCCCTRLRRTKSLSLGETTSYTST